jgi:hypothetical protein
VGDRRAKFETGANMSEEKPIRLIGTKIIVNIMVKSPTKVLTMAESDPRKWRMKPDAYIGTVEKVGPACEYVAPGDRVVVERWEYKQADWDDQRIIADETQVLVCQKPDGKEAPLPGVVVMDLINHVITKAPIIVPGRVIEHQRKKQTVYYGRVTATGSRTVQVGQYIWVEKRERHQYRYADGRFSFINLADSWGQYPILMVAERQMEVV